MATSARFRQLRQRLGELRRNMLPSKFDPMGVYPDRVRDRAKGYRLLVHAEVEAYIEDVVRVKVTSGITDWKNTGKVGQLILAFLASYHSGWSEYDEKHNQHLIELAKSRKSAKRTVADIVDRAQSQFVDKLRNNHGVREDDFRKLVLPTGLDIFLLSQSWLADLDDFGRQRGETAHTAKVVSAVVNPEDEHKRVMNLLIGLKDFDQKMQLV